MQRAWDCEGAVRTRGGRRLPLVRTYVVMPVFLFFLYGMFAILIPYPSLFCFSQILKDIKNKIPGLGAKPVDVDKDVSGGSLGALNGKL